VKRSIVLILATMVLLAACGVHPTPTLATVPPSLLPPSAVQPTSTASVLNTPPPPRTLTVFAAASLTDAFQEIGKGFEAAHPGVTVALNFAGSQTLRTQIEQGAMVDVFASADHTNMDTLVKEHMIIPDTPHDFLTNRLLIILPPANPAGVRSPSDLARLGLKLVLADQTVPVGKYARQVLDNMSRDPTFGSEYKTKVLANVVSNETDVKQVVVKVELGEADAGIVYISDAVAAPDLQTLQIPPTDNVIAKYPIAVLANAPQPDLAELFVEDVLSAQGQTILDKWGFTPVTP
jgi:molybdate transport system substrate-binding protein